MKRPVLTLTLAFAVGLALGCQDHAVTSLDGVQPRLGKGKGGGGGAGAQATAALAGAAQTVTDQDVNVKETGKQRTISALNGATAQYNMNIPTAADIDFSVCAHAGFTEPEARALWDEYAIDYAGLTHPDTGDPLRRYFAAFMSKPVETGAFYSNWAKANGDGMFARLIGTGKSTPIQRDVTVVEGPTDVFTYTGGVVSLDNAAVVCPNDGTAFSPSITVQVTLNR